MAVKNYIDPIDIHIVDKQTCQQGGAPVNQQQDAGDPLRSLSLDGALDCNPGSSQHQGHGTLIQGAEVIYGIPEQIGLLQKNLPPQRAGIGPKLRQRLLREKYNVAGAHTVRKICHGSKGQSHRFPTHKVNQHGSIDGPGYSEIHRRAQ